ncbi:MAG: hypothetical protein EBR82_57250 [Caulobacteraceae bacterium]|nr:hypothetical protein [Caulobacteraceae bacterium]
MMPIEQIFDTREDAPEWIRPALLEQDGKFVFQAELAHEVGGLKKALETERKQKAEAEKRLKGFEGVDVDQYQKLMAERDEIEAKQAQKAGDWVSREEQLKKQLQADLAKREGHYTAEIQGRDAKIALMQSALERSLITAEATSAISALKGTPELLLPHVMQRVRIFEEDGDYTVKVLDAQGQPRIADVKGTPFTIKHLVEEMRNDPVFGRAFEASGTGGSGAQNGNKAGGNAKAMSRKSFDALSPTQRMQFIRDGGSITDQ